MEVPFHVIRALKRYVQGVDDSFFWTESGKIPQTMWCFMLTLKDYSVSLGGKVGWYFRLRGQQEGLLEPGEPGECRVMEDRERD